MDDTQTKPIPFLGKGQGGFDNNPDIDECISWLEVQGFNPNKADLDYCPTEGTTFEVLHPIEDCGNGERRIFPIGRWRRVGRTDPGTSAIHATFQNVETDERMFICVGYAPLGGHAIMAWKNNIRLVSPT